ncbi:hypothetical protein BDK51DRAFT_49657 [Blyttiomyces helicus]|uniref:Uncharacterized protein n=1 Tax=Blyttiomyces helicus TaxID=388810 RepID=A0A4P9VVU9_9FUNG|nr:hypothetical protein BDK51DRAFT_49657 [Blyttiomyces helicus]|eukprot:RKO83804.1 hypothetical protein BDK51DRAFT_49657 [Blyttiomyces helicus]
MPTASRSGSASINLWTTSSETSAPPKSTIASLGADTASASAMEIRTLGVVHGKREPAQSAPMTSQILYDRCVAAAVAHLKAEEFERLVLSEGVDSVFVDYIPGNVELVEEWVSGKQRGEESGEVPYELWELDRSERGGMEEDLRDVRPDELERQVLEVGRAGCRLYLGIERAVYMPLLERRADRPVDVHQEAKAGDASHELYSVLRLPEPRRGSAYRHREEVKRDK